MTPLALGSEIPRRESALMRAVGRGILGLLGWGIEGEIPNLPKLVIAVAPHTSNWDFVVGAATMFALDLKLTFVGKHTLFQGPLAGMFRWMGGVPVDRTKPHGAVGDAVHAFETIDRRILAIAPQGTRSPVPHFKSGFLHIARGAHVPVLLASLDYGNRVVRFGPLVWPAEDVEAERERIEAFFSTVKGRNR